MVKVININRSHNAPILQQCPSLKQYSEFVELVRKHMKNQSSEQAISNAINECIERDILADFLKKHKARVIKMSIYEFDEEQMHKWDREEGREEGDFLRLVTLIRKKIKKGKSFSMIADEVEEDEATVSPIYRAVLDAGEETPSEEIVKTLLV